MKREFNFKNVNDVWAAVDAGKEVFWGNMAYHITVEKAHATSHTYTLRDGKVLRVTCKSNYFGSLLEESQLAELFTVSE